MSCHMRYLKVKIWTFHQMERIKEIKIILQNKSHKWIKRV